MLCLSKSSSRRFRSRWPIIPKPRKRAILFLPPASSPATGRTAYRRRRAGIRTFRTTRSDIKLQTDYILKNMAKTFKAAGTSLDNVVKAQVFLMDLNNFADFDEVWRNHFKSPPPRTTVGTTGLLVKDTLVEIDLIAALPGQKASVIKSDAPKPLANYSEAIRVGDLVFAAGPACQRLQDRCPGEC